MMRRAGILAAGAGAAMLMASALSAAAQVLPPDLLKVRKVTARGQSYWVQIEESFADPEVTLPDGQVVRAWQMRLAVAVSRAGTDFTPAAADQAEAQGVATGYCRVKGLAIRPAPEVDARFAPTSGQDRADWTFTGLCLEPPTVEVRK